ncbi:hypothetical protein EV363DRAFT_1265971 [Boletus edulis]|uniref:Uncharacterized protein n=1 Tax=Boletus edulis BED1 TaxID=1328754 RepID=A0AAD4BLV2_BOLED|nr:hypothetical protein EV363DRAFT_1265971 [Boletus edulis]KAF8433897.1 hypothetical protein L210DRAFT_954960 [Boletus edulis BED1]
MASRSSGFVEAINSPSCSIPAGHSDHQVELLAMDRNVRVAGWMTSKPKANLWWNIQTQKTSAIWRAGRDFIALRLTCGTANTESLIGWGGCPREFPIPHVAHHLRDKWMEALS